MSFTDTTFLLYFLPAMLVAHRLCLPLGEGKGYPDVAKALVFLSTLVFLGWHHPWWIVPLVATLASDYACARLMQRARSPGARRAWLLAALAQNVATLYCLKHWKAVYDAAPDAIAAYLPQLYLDGNLAPVPLGFAYFTLESLAFVIDVYRGNVIPPRRPLDLFAMLAMFPRLAAGPVARFRPLAAQLARYEGMQWDTGLALFAEGLVLKTCFADAFAVFTRYALDAGASIDFLSAWIGAIAIAMQLYFELAGYSLMAIGLSRTLGFSLPDNVDRPYHATSLATFFARWNISVTSWAREYAFEPLAKRGRRSRRALALLATFAIMGLWHDARATSLVAALWLGAWLCLEHRFRIPERLGQSRARILTLGIVLVGWVILRAPDLNGAMTILAAMLSPFRGAKGFSTALFETSPASIAACVLGLAYCFWWEPRRARLPLPRRLPVAWAMAALVAIYHVAALRLPPPAAGSAWATVKVTLRVLAATLDVDVPTRMDRAPAAIDGAALALRDTRATLAYRLGDVPAHVIKGPADPFRRLYPRAEAALARPEAAAGIREGFGREVHDFVAALESAGVSVVIVPVPPKLFIERDGGPGASASQAYAEYVRPAPESVVDLDSAFRDYRRRHADAALYQPAGSHLSSLGISLAASAIAEKLRSRGWKLARPELQYENKLVPEYAPDLLRSLRLPRPFVESSPEFQWFEPVYLIRPLTGGRDNGRVYVAGSGHSRRLVDSFGLGETLGRALGRIHIDSSIEHAGPTGPLEEMIREQIALVPGDLLIWEFPAGAPPRPGEAIPVPVIDRGGKTRRGSR